MVLAQYYNLLRLGMKGYTNIMESLMETSKYLLNKIEETNIFDSLTKKLVLPVITIKLKDEFLDCVSVFEISDKLRQHGWIIPAYTLPANAENIAVLRIVIKENFSRSMADILVNHLSEIEKYCFLSLDKSKHPLPHKNSQINIY
jgi:glutamate decarboxylase